MSDLFKILEKSEDKEGIWFQKLSELLLNNTSFMVGTLPYRITEIEFYYYSEQHPDPFTHRDVLQKTAGRWYFHREGESFRGGTFKGLDISFGLPTTYGGILIRTLEAPDGSQINGCSLCVDHLLEKTSFPKIEVLDQNIQERLVWDSTSPLHLKHEPSLENRKVYETPRVGLTLKRMEQYPEMPHYLMRPYRVLTDPTIKKGKVNTIVALYHQGLSAAELKGLTKSSAKSIQDYFDAIEAGKQLASVNQYKGKALNNQDFACLYGACSTL